MACAVTLWAAAAGAQDRARVWSRAEAVAAMAQASPDVARATAALARARVVAAGELGLFDPALGGQLDVRASRTPTDAALSSGIATNQAYSLALGVSRTIQTGARLQLQWINAVERSVFPFSTGLGFGDRRIVSGPNHQSQLVLTATQPLLRGRGRDATLVRVEAATRAALVREAEVVEVGTRALAALLAAYTELRYAETEVSVRARSLERTERQLAIAGAEVQAGQVAPIELDRIREQILARTELLTVAQAELRRRARAFERLVGAEPDGDARASDDLGAWAEAAEVGGGACTELDETHPALAVLGAQRQAAASAVAHARAAARPTLDLTVGYTQSGLDPSWHGAIGQMLRFEGRAVAIGAAAAWSPRNRAGDSAIDAAALDLAAVEFEQDEARRALCFAMRDLVDGLAVLRARDALAAARVALAERAVSAEADRFSAGFSTVQSGLDALELLESAELARTRLAADVVLAAIELARVEGRLLMDAVDTATPPPAAGAPE